MLAITPPETEGVLNLDVGSPHRTHEGRRMEKYDGDDTPETRRSLHGGGGAMASVDHQSSLEPKLCCER